MSKEIYLDNAATTPCDPRVLKAMEPYWSKIYGNPSSFNDAGREAKKAVDEARKKIALILGAKSQEIIFTSSATEANNLAIFGTVKAAARKIKKPHIITTQAEHHSVREPIKALEREGYLITYLPVNEEGIINLEELKKEIRPETVLISIIYANNEIGSIQPIKKISKIIKETKNSSGWPYFHTDAAQALGRLDINVNNLGVDLMTLSSQKIYGPKGVAALYSRLGILIEPVIYGGNQEWGLRSSTLAVPLVIGFAKAVEIIKSSEASAGKRLENLRNHFIKELQKIIPSVKINGPKRPEHRIPNIINMTFRGIENEQILLHLDKYGIRASAGSACASQDIEPSHILTAIGLSKEEARSSIRISLGRQTKKEDLDYILKVLPKVVKKIGELYPKELKNHYYVQPD